MVKARTFNAESPFLLEIARGKVKNHRFHRVFTLKADTTTLPTQTLFTVPALVDAYLVDFQLSVFSGVTAGVAFEVGRKTSFTPIAVKSLSGNNAGKSVISYDKIPSGSSCRLNVVQGSSSSGARVSGSYYLILVDDTK